MKKIASIKKACKLSDEAFSFVVKNIKKGMTEKHIASLIDDFIKERGASLSFPTIVGSGPNSFNLHHKPTNRKIKSSEPILLDFGAKISGFCSDISRTVFLNKITPFWKKIYGSVLSAQKEAEQELKDGVRAVLPDEISRKYLSKKGYEKNFIHTVGHSLSRRPHAGKVLGPGSKDILRKDDVVTLEPGIYIKGSGGVRIEDDYSITKRGFTVLTKSPKKVAEIIIK